MTAVRSSCSSAPNASNLGGGTVARSHAIISSRADRTLRSCGYAASAARTAAGICTGCSPRSMAPDLPEYAELHCLSNFTFLRGASHPEELVERAAALGYAALALTDECSFTGIVRAHVAAKRCG